MNISKYMKAAVASLIAAVTNQTSKSVSATTGAISIGLASNAVLPGTGAVTLPSGNTAARPGTPTNGMLRYNSQSNVVEAYVNGAWVTVTTA